MGVRGMKKADFWGDGFRALTSVLAALREAFEKKAWISYAIVLAVAAKCVWGMWLYRDLTTGDTSSYFVSANRWFEHFATNILWSPLYTMFYGEMLFATHSVYGATTLHRIVIVFAAALGVLALMRRLMSPGTALLVALWWTVMPINFETLYEVHLFALLPMLIVLIVACYATAPVHRGIILALLLGITVLVRNENSVVLAVFAAFCAVEEVVQPYDAQPRTRTWWKERFVAYLVPLAIVLTLIGACYVRTIVKYPEISAAAANKHTLNMGQVYAFGYSQRHPEFTASPWTEWEPLMKETFNIERPTLFQMLKANPSATLEHFAWNASLVVNGFQVALFNAMSGSVNPDYAPVQTYRFYAAAMSLIAGLILLGGAWRLQSTRPSLREILITHRHLVVLLVGLASTAFLIVVTQRPRPSYLFAFTVCLIALIGMSADLLTQRFRAAVNAAALLAGVAILVALPFYQQKHASARPLRANLLRLQPHQSWLAVKNNKLLIGDYAGELAGYLHFRAEGQVDLPAQANFQTHDYSVLTEWNRQEPLEHFLEQRGFTAIFVQPRVMPELQTVSAAKNLLEGGSQYKRLNSITDRDWGLYVIVPPATAPSAIRAFPADLAKANLEFSGIYADGWLEERGFVVLSADCAGSVVFRGMFPKGIGLDSIDLTLRVAGGEPVVKHLQPGSFEIRLPAEKGKSRIDFGFSSIGRLPSGDNRPATALLSSVSIESDDGHQSGNPALLTSHECK
jgi:hypothetical protein